MTSCVVVHGVAVPVSKPALPNFWPAGHIGAALTTVHVVGTLALAPKLSLAVKVVAKLPTARGVPETTPVLALTVSPGGRPTALKVILAPARVSVARS